MMRRIMILIIGLALFQTVLAQENEGGEIEDAQIVIEKDKPLTLPKADRIYKRTNIKPVTKETQQLEYTISQPTFEFAPYDSKFRIQSYDAGKKLNVGAYNNYIKAGFGNYESPLLQGYFGLTREENHTGIWINHESFNKGPTDQFSSASYGFTEVLLNGHLNSESFVFDPQVYFQREGYFAYGFTVPPNVDFVSPGKIGASTFSFVPEFTWLPSDEFTIGLHPWIQNSLMKFEDVDPFNQEFEIGMDIDGNYQINDDFSLGTRLGVSHLKYESGFEQKRNLFQINPFIEYQNDVLFIHGGFKVASGGGDSIASKAYLYPDIKAKLQFGPQFGLFANASGDLNPITLNNMRLQNRYLTDSLTLRNTSTPLDIDAGVEFNIAEKLLLKGYVGYKRSNNASFFVHNPLDSARFQLVYEDEGFVQVKFGGELAFLAGVNTMITSIVEIYGYDLEQQQEAWYLPTFRFDVNARQTLFEKLHLDFGMKLLGGIKAPSPVSFEVMTLTPIIDLGIGATYDIKPNISAFLKLNNLLSKNYERYLNYPSRGFMIKAGFIYRF